MNYGFRLINRVNVVKAVTEARSSFKEQYPWTGEEILEELELHISCRYNDTDLLDLTVKKEEIRQLSDIFRIGPDHILCEVVFKIDYNVAEWLVFRYGPYVPAAGESLPYWFLGLSEEEPPRD